ncbi:MAG: Hpt domain-containing protein [Spirochaetia bacterium]
MTEEHSARQQPPFDIAALEAQSADAPEILEEIFSIFLEETPERLQMLRDGIADGDASRVKKAAHSLANTSGTLMAQRALTLARATESAARDENFDEMRTQAELLRDEVEQILEQIRSRG